MKLVTVPLSRTLLAPENRLLRKIDQDRAKAICASYLSGSRQLSPFLAYEHPKEDVHLVFGGCTSYTGFRMAFAKEHPDATVSLLLFENGRDFDASSGGSDLLLWAARADNHEPLGTETWIRILKSLKDDYPTQRALAEAVGLKETTVSEYLNADPQARHEAENEERRKLRAAKAQNGTSESPPPQLGEPSRPPTMPEPPQHPSVGSGLLPVDGERESGGSGQSGNSQESLVVSHAAAANPAIHPPSPSPDDTAPTTVQSMQSLRESASHSAGIRSGAVQGDVSSPPASHSPLPALQKAVEALLEATEVSLWEDADDATARAARVVLARLGASEGFCRLAEGEEALVVVTRSSKKNNGHNLRVGMKLILAGMGRSEIVRIRDDGQAIVKPEGARRVVPVPLALLEKAVKA